MLKRFIFMGCALAALFAGAPTAAAQEFIIIVNDANPVQAISKDDLSKLFLKRATEWDNGSAVVPVDLPEASAVRAAFSQQVHGRPVSAIEAYWQRQIFSGRGVPPVEKTAESEVIEFVRTNPMAVGYVHNGSALGSGVRTLRVVN